MKKTLFFLIFCAVCVSSCDFVRTIAGRPTSDFINNKRQRIIEIQARQKAQADSLAVIAKMKEDSIAQATLAQKLLEENLLFESQKVTKVEEGALSFKYYVVIGAFSSVDNARKLEQQAAQSGFQTIILPYRNGMNAVALNPCDDLSAAYAALQEAKKYPFCPENSWILDNSK